MPLMNLLQDTPAAASDDAMGPPDGVLRNGGTVAGAVQVDAPYVNGAIEGELVAHDERGRLLQQANYHGGLQHGTTRLYSDGRLCLEQTYEAGVLHGACTGFDPSGSVNLRQTYVQGRLEGDSVSLQMGLVIRHECYREGRLNGETAAYDRDGALTQRSLYKDGLLHGIQTRYWPGGGKLEEQEFLKGIPSGEPSRFDANGRAAGDAPVPLGWMGRLETLVKG